MSEAVDVGSLPLYSLVELPCVCPATAAERMLGGTDALRFSVLSRAPALPMRLVPAPEAAPWVGVRSGACGLLLRVSRRGSGETSVRAVGRVDCRYSFDATADFRFLSGEPSTQVLETVPRRFLSTPQSEAAQPFGGETGVLLGRPEGGASADVRARVATRAPTRLEVQVVRLGEPVPQHCRGPAIQRRDGAKHRAAVRALQELFARRPMLSRRLIAADPLLSASSHAMAERLPDLAYYMSAGPFAKAWTRLGYDPLSDPSSRLLQSMQICFNSDFIADVMARYQSLTRPDVCLMGAQTQGVLRQIR